MFGKLTVSTIASHKQAMASQSIVSLVFFLYRVQKADSNSILF